jgi:hypothetical protein
MHKKWKNKNPIMGKSSLNKGVILIASLGNPPSIQPMVVLEYSKFDAQPKLTNYFKELKTSDKSL